MSRPQLKPGWRERLTSMGIDPDEYMAGANEAPKTGEVAPTTTLREVEQKRLDYDVWSGAIKSRNFPLKDWQTVGGDLGAARDRMTAAGFDHLLMFPELANPELYEAIPRPNAAQPLSPEDQAHLADLRQQMLHPTMPGSLAEAGRPSGPNDGAPGSHATWTSRGKELFNNELARPRSS
jgi:hypothetical protein